MAINNQGIFIGKDTDGFLWYNGTETALTSLIPSAYSSEISYITPRLISNSDTNGVIQILIDARFTDPSTTISSTNTYVLSGSYASLTRGSWALAQVQLPSGMSTANIHCINNSGILATANLPADGVSSSPVVGVLPPVTFTVTNLNPSVSVNAQQTIEPAVSDAGDQGVFFQPFTAQSIQAQITINVGDASIPQSIRDSIAKRYRFGYIQNVISDKCYQYWSNATGWWYLKDGVPRLDCDNWGGVSACCAFAYGFGPFSADNQTWRIVDMVDSPCCFASYDSPNQDLLDSLTSIYMNKTFRTWVAVQDTQTGTYTFLKYFDWGISGTVTVDCSQPLGQRMKSCVTTPSMGSPVDGPGNSSPCITLPIANDDSEFVYQ